MYIDHSLQYGYESTRVQQLLGNNSGGPRTHSSARAVETARCGDGGSSVEYSEAALLCWRFCARAFRHSNFALGAAEGRARTAGRPCDRFLLRTLSARFHRSIYSSQHLPTLIVAAREVGCLMYSMLACALVCVHLPRITIK